MDLPKFIRLVADIIDATHDETPQTRERELLVCMHCQNILRIDGDTDSLTTFVPRQVINPLTMRAYYTPWKYRCGKCDKWGVEYDIDEVLPQTNSTN